MHESFEQFMKLASPWLPGYDRISVSALGVKKGDRHFLLSARVYLLSPLRQAFQRPPLDDSVFWGLTDEVRFVPAEFPALLERLAAGCIALGRVDGELPREPQANLSPWFYAGNAPSDPQGYEDPRLPLFRVTGGSRGVLIYSAINSGDVEWHLHSHRPPFKNLGDLHRHYDVPQNESGDATLIEVIVEPPLAITARSSIENGRVLVNVHAAKGLAVEKVSIGYVAEVAGKTKRGNIDVIQWVEKDRIVEGSAQLDLGDCPEADCLLTFAGTGIQHVRLTEGKRRLNVRTAIQEAFDPELKRLCQLLFEVKRDDAKRFEDGVALLFGMLGFSIAQHGRAPKLADAPDVVATTQAGNIAVVECTIDLPDKRDQVAIAVKRAEQARRGLDNSGWPKIQVLPVVVTMLGEREIAGQKEDAEEKGVLVLCSDDLRKAIDTIKRPVDADELFKEWVNWLSRPNFMRTGLF
ncbi:MAG: hypothetical protein HY017_32415 [Betaproteobacteria bacterium]|nr:hypothetical protein [Betaproteobacteria bacterium]